MAWKSCMRIINKNSIYHSRHKVCDIPSYCIHAEYHMHHMDYFVAEKIFIKSSASGNLPIWILEKTICPSTAISNAPVVTLDCISCSIDRMREVHGMEMHTCRYTRKMRNTWCKNIPTWTKKLFSTYRRNDKKHNSKKLHWILLRLQIESGWASGTEKGDVGPKCIPDHNEW